MQLLRGAFFESYVMVLEGGGSKVSDGSAIEACLSTNTKFSRTCIVLLQEDFGRCDIYWVCNGC
jgi:hypothetical protein